MAWGRNASQVNSSHLGIGFVRKYVAILLECCFLGLGDPVAGTQTRTWEVAQPALDIPSQ